jgi:hypothetical protein
MQARSRVSGRARDAHTKAGLGKDEQGRYRTTLDPKGKIAAIGGTSARRLLERTSNKTPKARKLEWRSCALKGRTA